MSVNRNALIRYHILDGCFRNPGRRYFLEDLLEECNKALKEFNPDNTGIKRRQLYDDIRFMESEQGWSIALKKEIWERKAFYRYEDLSFSINNLPINQSETEQLGSALAMLSRFEGAPQFEWLSEMMPMLRNTFGLEEPERKIISNETNVFYSGFDKITPIFNAIVNKRALKIRYKPYTEEERELIFHPHYLKQYNNRWFAFGYNATANEEMAHLADIWNLALDRIEEFTEQSDAYIENTINWDEELFGDIVGVSRKEGDVQEVKLWFSSDQAPYITSKSIHASQRPAEVHEDGSITVRIFVVPNYELETLILGFGEKVKVLAPESLRQKISERVEKMQVLYSAEA